MEKTETETQRGDSKKDRERCKEKVRYNGNNESA